ncbi:Hypothetical protein PHPALM_36511 [Phytophthora palmivora]|uniref:PiggyBac transposable element-derived protein domain-containing protein n=1 Tax=Phytophthora palmivora TaxID=4796 RepID=A0A2P4WZR6_9STRA|nr:Hypothetical protein PHPALM_36511 [Phytophthora palmivora]
MAFQARWRELKKTGWTSKKPTGLSVDFTYLRPGKTKKDARGLDYFVGEEELMKHLDEIDIAKKKARREGSANAARRRKAQQAVETKKTPEENHFPVVAPTDLCSTQPPHRRGARRLQTSPFRHGLACSRRNLDPDFEDVDGSSNASDPSAVDNDAGSSQAIGTEEESNEGSRVGVEFDEGVDGDVNRVVESDHSNQFAGFDSDAENDGGDDDDSLTEYFDAEDVQLPIPPELPFGDRLISAFGGLENIAGGAVPDTVLKEMGEEGWSDLVTNTPYDYLMEPYEARSSAAMREDYPNLYDGNFGPTAKALAAAETPSGGFFYFLQPELWEEIAEESNDYFEESLDERVEGQHAKQVAREQNHPNFKAKTRERIRDELLKVPAIEAREMCHRFAAGYVPPAIMAFDEAMLPSRSTFNRMRVYIKDKPHKWGTKLFMLCCSATAYCIRFEVYCGKKERAGNSSSTDHKSGPAAVVRNLQQVFGPTVPSNGDMRLVVTDRFYSSVPLSLQHLTMGLYLIGAVRTDRQGLSTKLIPKKKKGDKKKPPKTPKNRPANIERGTFVVAEALHIPAMRVLRWWDTRPVHMLSTGGSVEPDRIVRRDKLTGEQQEVMCPRIVKDYQTYMGGVDVHDQLRLQRYSLQLCIK